MCFPNLITALDQFPFFETEKSGISHIFDKTDFPMACPVVKIYFYSLAYQIIYRTKFEFTRLIKAPFVFSFFETEKSGIFSHFWRNRFPDGISGSKNLFLFHSLPNYLSHKVWIYKINSGSRCVFIFWSWPKVRLCWYFFYKSHCNIAFTMAKSIFIWKFITLLGFPPGVQIRTLIN